MLHNPVEAIPGFSQTSRAEQHVEIHRNHSNRNKSRSSSTSFFRNNMPLSSARVPWNPSGAADPEDRELTIKEFELLQVNETDYTSPGTQNDGSNSRNSGDGAVHSNSPGPGGIEGVEDEPPGVSPDPD